MTTIKGLREIEPYVAGNQPSNMVLILIRLSLVMVQMIFYQWHF